MPAPDRRIDVYLKKHAEPWGPTMAALRAILLDTPLTETFKWRQPCYAYGGRNVVILSAYKDFAVLAFFRGALLADPEGILHTPGKHSQAARQLRFTAPDEVTEREAEIRDFLAQAIRLVEEGKTVDFREKHDLTYPEELTAALDEDPELAEAFEALTPGRKRGWVLLFEEPKQSRTRSARIAKARPKILAGRGRHDR